MTDTDSPTGDDVDLRDLDPEARARALQSLLIEDGLLTADAVDEIVSMYEEDVGPMVGSRVVARAWTDPEYREFLLEDGIAAVAELDVALDDEVMELRVVENDPATHNVVVCTLCSCYPWAVLGLPPTWYKSPAYRSRVVDEPRALLHEEFDTEIPEDVELNVWDSNSEIRYLVLPQRPDGTEDMTEAELAELVSRNAMIGVDRLTDGGAISADGGTRTTADHSPSPRATPASEPTFAEPWQARAFALAVALTDEDTPGRTWDDFQRELVDEVNADRSEDLEVSLDATDTDDAYYRQWLRALERFLDDRDAIEATAFHTRAVEFATGERDAHEFVRGDPHDHADRLPEGHADGTHGHDHPH